MKTPLLLLLLTSSVSVFSQTIPPILGQKELKKGIYKTYAEFILNQPSLQNEFNLNTRSDARDIEEGTASVKLEILDSAVSRRDLKAIWGVCDGEHVYINEFGVSGRIRFRQLMERARYSYLLCGVRHTVSAGFGPAAMITAAAASYYTDEYFIININNGKFFQLDRTLLLTILDKDEELLASYKAENRPRTDRVLIEYIKKYNQRHAEDAKLDFTNEKVVVILRNPKDEYAPPIAITVNDSLSMEMQRGSLYQAKTTKPFLTVCQDQDCQTFFLSKRNVNYLQLKSDDTGKVVFKQLEPNEGEYEFRQVQQALKKLQRK